MERADNLTQTVPGHPGAFLFGEVMHGRPYNGCVISGSITRQKPLFPEDRNSALMIRADLKAAGIPSDDYDFHGLRHCFVSQTVQSGASVKDAMELARHHDADLTFGRYAHTRLEELSKVVDKLPDLWEKCGKGNGLSVDPNSKAGMGDAIYREPLTPDFPTLGLWE
ncbi:MAG: hypothetical protein JO114_20915 [Planctomycetaceae bacterium]|nr:hypothetical protein [Planctomycetaceae bacterium]